VASGTLPSFFIVPHQAFSNFFCCIFIGAGNSWGDKKLLSAEGNVFKTSLF
jgi:hypothetical protein